MLKTSSDLIRCEWKLVEWCVGGFVRARECESNRNENLNEPSSGSKMQGRRTVSSLGDYPSGVPGMESWHRGFAWQSAAAAAVKRIRSREIRRARSGAAREKQTAEWATVDCQKTAGVGFLLWRRLAFNTARSIALFFYVVIRFSRYFHCR